MFTFLFGLFVLAASCYILFIISDPLEDVGGRLGELLNLPEDVIASTFQALATSGPEIVMAVLAATPFIAGEVWQTLEMGERACSGTLNMAFSAMANLLGIGAVAIVFMIRMKRVDPEESIPAAHSTIIGLGFYIVASGALSIFIRDSVLTEGESWFLMIFGILFVLSQFFVPNMIDRYWPNPKKIRLLEEQAAARAKAQEESGEKPTPKLTESPTDWAKDLTAHGFLYAFLVFALVVFVREAMGATFNMAMVSMFSIGGIVLMFTSYVSSFPEFMLAYRYTISDKKHELLGMLFGSNVIDLAFAGFRAMWLHEPMEVYTTGQFPQLLPLYIWALPIIAVLLLGALLTKTMKWKYAYPLFWFYVIYVVSGFILL